VKKEGNGPLNEGKGDDKVLMGKLFSGQSLGLETHGLYIQFRLWILKGSAHSKGNSSNVGGVRPENEGWN